MITAEMHFDEEGLRRQILAAAEAAAMERLRAAGITNVSISVRFNAAGEMAVQTKGEPEDLAKARKILGGENAKSNDILGDNPNLK